MKKMLLILVFGMLVVTFPVLNAQVSPTQLLEWTNKHLDNRDCEKAEETYKMYKEKISGGNTEVEQRILKCREDQRQKEQIPVQQNVTAQVKGNNGKLDLSETNERGEGNKNLWKDRDNPYCKAGRNRYVAWTIAGAGYPWNVTMGVELRGGGILGIGGYADIGVDISRYQFEYVINYDKDIISNNHIIVHSNFRYIGGLRLFYKGMFFSIGYGSISRVSSVSLEYNDVDAYWEVWKDDLSKIEKGHGLHVNIGYNLCTEPWGFFLGVSGGFAYDVVNKIMVPSFSLKLGMTFDWKKY